MFDAYVDSLEVLSFRELYERKCSTAWNLSGVDVMSCSKECSDLLRIRAMTRYAQCEDTTMDGIDAGGS